MELLDGEMDEEFQAWIGGENCIGVQLGGGTDATVRGLFAAEPVASGATALTVRWRNVLTIATAEKALRREEKRGRPLLRLSVDELLAGRDELCRRCFREANGGTAAPPPLAPAALALQSWSVLLALQLLTIWREPQ